MITILSLFDGLGGARIALDKLNIPCKYYASEIDKYAIKIAMKNYPDIIQLGDVTKLGKETPYPEEIINGVDLIIFGSPCQGLSISKQNRQGLNDERSKLFYEAVRIMKDIPHKYFLMENVASMSKENKQIITGILGVEPILINSSSLTAQQRKRLYWTNIKGIIQPEDKHIYLKDILESDDTEKLKSYCIDANYWKGTNLEHYLEKGVRRLVFNKSNKIDQINNGGQGNRIYSIESKSVSLSANGGGWGSKTGLYLINNLIVRKLTPLECERLQGLKDNYSEGVSNTQRYKMIGNGFTIPIISHILSFVNEWKNQ